MLYVLLSPIIDISDYLEDVFEWIVCEKYLLPSVDQLDMLLSLFANENLD